MDIHVCHARITINILINLSRTHNSIHLLIKFKAVAAGSAEESSIRFIIKLCRFDRFDFKYDVILPIVII